MSTHKVQPTLTLPTMIAWIRNSLSIVNFVNFNFTFDDKNLIYIIHYQVFYSYRYFNKETPLSND